MADSWIRVAANLCERRVVLRAAEHCGVSLNEAIGLLVRFWGSMSRLGDNGRVDILSDFEIEAWAGWTGPRGVFAAFVREKHADADGRINEWDEYAGALEARRARERDRLRGKRASVAQQTHVVAQHGTGSDTDVATDPDVSDGAVDRHSEPDTGVAQHVGDPATDVAQPTRNNHATCQPDHHVAPMLRNERATPAQPREIVATRARANDNDNENRLSSSSPLPRATRFVAAANRGLAEHPIRPQAIPRILVTQGATLAACDAWDGIPDDFVEGVLYELAKSHSASDGISSLRYFVAAVRRRWEQHKAAEAAAAATPPRITDIDAPDRRGRGRRSAGTPAASGREDAWKLE